MANTPTLMKNVGNQVDMVLVCDDVMIADFWH